MFHQKNHPSLVTITHMFHLLLQHHPHHPSSFIIDHNGFLERLRKLLLYTLTGTNIAPKKGLPNGKVVFKPSIFRGELLVAGRVRKKNVEETWSLNILCQWKHPGTPLSKVLPKNHELCHIMKRLRTSKRLSKWGRTVLSYFIRYVSSQKTPGGFRLQNGGTCAPGTLWGPLFWL